MEKQAAKHSYVNKLQAFPFCIIHIFNIETALYNLFNIFSSTCRRCVNILINTIMIMKMIIPDCMVILLIYAWNMKLRFQSHFSLIEITKNSEKQLETAFSLGGFPQAFQVNN